MQDDWSFLGVWTEFSKFFQQNNVGEESGILRMWNILFLHDQNYEIPPLFSSF